MSKCKDCPTPIRCAVKDFIKGTLQVFLAIVTMALVIIVTTYTTNAKRVTEYRNLEAKLDALVEYSALQWADQIATDVINAGNE